MYDELVKRLRESVANHDDKCESCQFEEDYPCCVDCLDKMHKEAADAIEALSKLHETQKKNLSVLTDAYMKSWIPVTEEPPLKVGDDGYIGYLVYANGYYEVADYTTDKFDNVPYFHVNGEYEPDVTHWMPLPEPPKQGEKK